MGGRGCGGPIRPNVKISNALHQDRTADTDYGIRMVTRDTIRDMVISVLNLRRKAAPYMLSTANSRTPKILAITVGMPNRTFISSEKRATVAATVTRPIIMV